MAAGSAPTADHVNVQAFTYRARRWRDLFETTNQVDHIGHFERKNTPIVGVYEADLLTTAMPKRGKFHALAPGFPRPGWKPNPSFFSNDDVQACSDCRRRFLRPLLL